MNTLAIIFGWISVWLFLCCDAMVLLDKTNHTPLKARFAIVFLSPFILLLLGISKLMSKLPGAVTSNPL